MQKSIKRQRFAIIALAGIIVAGGFIAAFRPVRNATFDIITCKGWQVVDKNGKPRIAAEIYDDSNQRADVTLYDTNGRTRISAVTFDDGYAVSSWYDANGKKRISASTFVDGHAAVMFEDKQGETRFSASTEDNGAPGMMWYDKDGKPRIAALIGSDGTVVLPTRDLSPPKKP